MKLENSWKYKTLSNLERNYHIDTAESSVPLVKRCNELIRLPLSEFATEDIRLMIGQAIGLSYLVPLAIDKLNHDLFAEGDLYEGDLLTNVLGVDSLFWKQNPDLWTEIDKLIVNKRNEIDRLKISVEKFYN